MSDSGRDEIPDQGEVYTHRGQAWRAKGEADKANADFKEAARLNPTLRIFGAFNPPLR